jgi:hypothetical protein
MVMLKMVRTDRRGLRTAFFQISLANCISPLLGARNNPRAVSREVFSKSPRTL